MMIIFKLNSCTAIELEGQEYLPGSLGKCNGPWEDSYPSEGATYEYFRACVVRHGRERQVPVLSVIKALERRLGSSWEEEGEIVTG